MHCSSASGMEALDASRAEVLTAAGHNVKSSWCLAKWPSRGQLASTRRIVEEHFEWLVLQDGGKPSWVCKHCTWTNQMKGFVRPMEHIMFWEAMKPKNYLIIHELQRVDDIPALFQQFLEKYSSRNLRNFLQRKNPSKFLQGLAQSSNWFSSIYLPLYEWMFPKIGVPQIIHFDRVFHYKPSILGYHYFWKHPYPIKIN